MALNWIAGGSGSGKTEYLYKKIIEMSLAEPDARFFILVPEQATMQAQKEIVRLHPRLSPRHRRDARQISDPLAPHTLAPCIARRAFPSLSVRRASALPYSASYETALERGKTRLTSYDFLYFFRYCRGVMPFSRRKSRI